MRSELYVGFGFRLRTTDYGLRTMSYLLSFALCLFSVAAAPQQKVVDQILTLVNDEVITRIDLLWSLALDPQAPNPANGVNADLLRQKLDVMIDERLINQEATRIPTTDVSQDEVNVKRQALIATFANETAFRQRLEAVGLTAEKLDELLRRRILIEKYVAFRFESFVFVTDQEVQEYFEQKLVPRLKERGEVPPALDKVSEMIRTLLKEEKKVGELERWLTSARQRAEIISLVEP
jgi:hypothetical protein